MKAFLIKKQHVNKITFAKDKKTNNRIEECYGKNIQRKQRTLRKIKRSFRTAKEHHRLRYTQCKRKACIEMKTGLTFAL